MSCLSEDIMVFWRGLEHGPYVQDFEEDGYLCVTFNPYASLQTRLFDVEVWIEKHAICIELFSLDTRPTAVVESFQNSILPDFLSLADCCLET